MSDVDSAIDDLRDRLTIPMALTSISLDGDTGDVDTYGAHFTDDAIIESPAGVTTGRAAIVESAAARRQSGAGGPGSGTRHHVLPGLVTIEGDRAVARSTFSFYTTAQGRPQLTLIGEYRDELVRAGDSWRVSRRVVSFG